MMTACQIKICVFLLFNILFGEWSVDKIFFLFLLTTTPYKMNHRFLFYFSLMIFDRNNTLNSYFLSFKFSKKDDVLYIYTRWQNKKLYSQHVLCVRCCWRQHDVNTFVRVCIWWNKKETWLTSQHYKCI